MIYEQRSRNGELVQTVRIPLETTPELLAQYAQDGFTEVYEHHIVLYKPPEKIVLKEKLDSIAAALPDEIAIEHTDLYPVWSAGMQLSAGDRVRHTDALYRVQQAHATQSDWTPDTAASLFSRINAPGDIPAWEQGSYAKDVEVEHRGYIWLSGVDNNVWEPGAVGVHDHIWKKVREA